MKKTLLILAAVTAAALPATALAATTRVALHGGAAGSYLVDGKGKALYLFEKDKHGKSSCYGGCAKAWPPALISKGKPSLGKGVKASLIGTVKRTDGKLQVTYNKHPLYYYVGDTKAGQTTGQGIDGFGAEWYILSAKGSKIETEHATGDDSSSSSSGRYGSDSSGY